MAIAIVEDDGYDGLLPFTALPVGLYRPCPFTSWSSFESSSPISRTLLLQLLRNDPFPESPCLFPSATSTLAYSAHQSSDDSDFRHLALNHPLFGSP